MAVFLKNLVWIGDAQSTGLQLAIRPFLVRRWDVANPRTTMPHIHHALFYLIKVLYGSGNLVPFYHWIFLLLLMGDVVSVFMDGILYVVILPLGLQATSLRAPLYLLLYLGLCFGIQFTTDH